MTDQFELDIKLNTSKKQVEAQPLLQNNLDKLNNSNQYQGPAAIQHISGHGISKDLSYPNHEDDGRNLSMPGLA